MLPTETRFCGVECRVANAVMAVRAANALPANTEGVSELWDAVLDRLDEVLREVRDGRYVPSMIDAMAALEFAREKAGSGCMASELPALIQGRDRCNAWAGDSGPAGYGFGHAQSCLACQSPSALIQDRRALMGDPVFSS